MLVGSFLSDHPAHKSRSGHLNLDVGTLTLNGGTRLPYKLSTGYTRSEDQFVYTKVQFILVPPHFRIVPPHFGCSGDGTA